MLGFTAQATYAATSADKPCPIIQTDCCQKHTEIKQDYCKHCDKSCKDCCKNCTVDCKNCCDKCKDCCKKQNEQAGVKQDCDKHCTDCAGKDIRTEQQPAKTDCEQCHKEAPLKPAK